VRYTAGVVGFVDLHSHVLFGLDDGARDLAASRAMLDGLVALGFTEVYATPHQKVGQFLPSRVEIDAAYTTVSAAIGAPTLRLGAENMWDALFFDRSQDGTIPSYDDGDAFLVELSPIELPVGLFDHLFRLRMSGKIPVLAHPERYQPLWRDRDQYQRLAGQCALVIDLGAVAGYHGRSEQKAARRLLEDGLAAAVASDAHTLEDIRVAAEGMAWIERRMGRAALVRLLDDGPRAILAGELPE